MKDIKTPINKKDAHTGEVSDAILSPLESVVILVLLCSTKSGSESGRATPPRGMSRGGRALERSPVSQLNKPPDEVLAATAAEVENLMDPKLPPWP